MRRRLELVVTEDFFPIAVRYVIQNEIGSDPKRNGGYTNRPSDRGGPTRWGITYRTLRFARAHSLGVETTPEDVAELTREEAEKIYREIYWDQAHCSKFQAAIATVVLDTTVLYGVFNGVCLTQTALCEAGFNTKIDGIIGPKTTEALQAISVKSFIENIQVVLSGYIESIVKHNPDQTEYEKGWKKRVERLGTLV